MSMRMFPERINRRGRCVLYVKDTIPLPEDRKIVREQILDPSRQEESQLCVPSVLNVSMPFLLTWRVPSKVMSLSAFKGILLGILSLKILKSN